MKYSQLRSTFFQRKLLFLILSFLGILVLGVVVSLVRAQQPSQGKEKEEQSQTRKTEKQSESKQPEAKETQGEKAADTEGKGPDLKQEDIVYFDGGRVKVFIDQEDERIEIETLLLETKGSILEFLLAGLGGPFHESLLKTAAKAYSIQQGLEILGYRESQIKPRFRGDPLELQGEMFELSVRWYDQSGQKHEHALESWLYNQRQQKSLEAGGWVFTGSLRANASEEKGRVMLQADVLGHLIALYRDPSSLINTPLADAVHDSAFTTHPSALYPEPGTQVILILRHFQKPEASPQAATEAEEKPVSKQNE